MFDTNYLHDNLQTIDYSTANFELMLKKSEHEFLTFDENTDSFEWISKDIE